MNAHFGRAEAHLQRFGDLLVWAIFDIAQHHHDTPILGELGIGFVPSRRKVSARDAMVEREKRALARRPVTAERARYNPERKNPPKFAALLCQLKRSLMFMDS